MSSRIDFIRRSRIERIGGGRAGIEQIGRVRVRVDGGMSMAAGAVGGGVTGEIGEEGSETGGGEEDDEGFVGDEAGADDGEGGFDDGVEEGHHDCGGDVGDDEVGD